MEVDLYLLTSHLSDRFSSQALLALLPIAPFLLWKQPLDWYSILFARRFCHLESEL